MPTVHEYPVDVTWNGGREGSGEVIAEHSKQKIGVAVPQEFQGPGGATNPEELLTSAIGACYGMTFGIIAQNRKLPIVSLRVKVIGEVEQNGPQFTYKSVTIKPHIVVESAATEDQLKLVEDMAHKADSYCIITNAVRGKVEIAVDPVIVKG